MKKLISIFSLLILIFVFSFSIIAIDNSAPTICFENSVITVNPGDTVSVALLIKDNCGIAGATFSLDYDTDNITVSAEKGNLFGGFLFDKNLVIDSDKNVTTDGILANFKFTVSDSSAIGDYSVKVISRNIINEDFDDVVVNCGELTLRVVEKCKHENTVIKNAIDSTCTSSGYSGDKYCLDCGEIIENGTIIANKNHTEVIDEAVAATCTKSGLTEGSHCSVCNTVIVAQKTVNTIPHTYFDSVTQPTCIVDGYTTHTCSVCGSAYIDTLVEKIGHKYVVITKKASCLVEGSITNTCELCGMSYVEKIPALDHDIVSHDAKASTCTENGWDTFETCSRCDYTTYKEIASLGHNYQTVANSSKAATCIEKGKEADQKCLRCNDVITGAEIAMVAHSVKTDNAVAPTCTETGLTEGSHCSVCGTVIVAQKIITKVAHSYTKIVDSKYLKSSAGCSSKAVYYKSCSICGAKSTETFTWGNVVHQYEGEITKATTTKDGKTVLICKICKLNGCSFIIYKASKVSISATSYTYNGKVQKPTLTVKDSKGNTVSSKYYTAAWSNASSKSVGTYTVTVTFKGNYSGTKILTYKILPKQVTGLKAASVKTTSVALTWTKVTGAKYYKVEQSTDGKTWRTITTVSTNTLTDSGLKAGTTYQYRVTALDSTKKIAGKASAVLKATTLCSAPTIKLTSTKKATATVTITKVTGAKSYVIYTSTDNKKWTKVTTTTKTSYDLTKLTAGKKIYVKVVAVNADKANSAYSKVASVTVKK